MKIEKILENIKNKHIIPSEQEIEYICSEFKRVCTENIYSNVIRVSSPISIVGDINGNLDNLISIFDLMGVPPYNKFLFLGNYVDKGKQSLFVICYLFCLKILFPNQIFLLRGCHEFRLHNKYY